MPAGIFISYRRLEALAEARGIYERLRAEFGHSSVFIDLEGLDYGEDFVESLDRQLQHCQVLIALIGPQWLATPDGHGGRRLDDENDFVRIELRTALQRGIRVVPVLLNGAVMPRTNDLPADLQPLLRRQALELEFRKFDADIGRLVGSLRRILTPAAPVAPVVELAADPVVQAVPSAPQPVSPPTPKPAPAPAPRPQSAPPPVQKLLQGAMGAEARTGQGTAGVAGRSPKTFWSAVGAAAVAIGVAWINNRGPAIGPESVGGVSVSAHSVSQRFRDCDDDTCPWMVVLPAGSFMMGSPEGEPGRQSDEGPQRRVQVVSFAIGQYEVTFRQWDACVAAGGCKTKPGDEGWGRGERPVINVSWDDAQQYVKWLSSKTGQTYRLPSEAEWEYAARAGTTTPYAFGSSLRSSQSNVFFPNSFNNFFARNETRAVSLPIGSLARNGWDLHDLHGNVEEWVQDCWHDSYEGAPIDGSAWISSCTKDERLLRGGNWISEPEDARSANRNHFKPSERHSFIGFRLARMLM